MKMKDFYLPFLSDSSLTMFPDNKQSEFTVRLDHPIHIESKMKDGKWLWLKLQHHQKLLISQKKITVSF